MTEFPLAAVINTDDRSWSDGVRFELKCPVCSFNYQHCSQPEVVKGNDDYQAGWGGRGDLIRIPVWGECGSEWEICFGFHKGNTYPFAHLLKSCQELGQSALVYFIEAVGLSKVKIGVSDDPEKRLRQLATGSAVPLKLLATISGDVADEKELHRRFEHLRFEGEWFHETKELLAFIESYRA